MKKLRLSVKFSWILLILPLIAVAPKTSQGAVWNIEVVDTGWVGGDVGEYCSLQVDSVGNLHVAYFDHANERLKYAYFDQAWNVEIVDTEGGTWASLLLDSHNAPHVCYRHSSFLKCASMIDGTWRLENVPAYSSGAGMSATMAAGDVIHISAYFSGIYHIFKSGSNWEENDCGLSAGGYGTAIAIDDGGGIYIADSGHWGEGVVAYFNGYAWQQDSVTASQGYTMTYPAMDIDSMGNVHLLFTEKYSPYSYHYFRFDGTWREEKLNFLSNGEGGAVPDLIVDSNDNVHMSLRLSGNLVYATNEKGKWQVETVDDGTEIGIYSSLGIDKNNLPVIAYYDATGQNLNVARKLSKEIDAAKAIIVATGGVSNDAMVNGMRYCAGLSFRNLIHQGFSADQIYFLTDIAMQDMDGVDPSKIRDDFPSVHALEYAVTDWAAGAGDLILYLLGHGGDGTFRIDENQLLYAEDLDRWLDEFQAAASGNVVLIYDACESGSFVEKLTCPPGKTRVLVASAEKGQKAVFADNGAMSFSGFFWAGVAGGDDFYDAFLRAEKGVNLFAENRQSSLIDVNGNGIANEKEDRQGAEYVWIGKQIDWLDEIPSIGSCSPSHTVTCGDEVTIFAKDVIDEDGIAHVTAVIAPPGAWDGDSDIPVSDLPVIELANKGDNRYEAVYDGFDIAGEYMVSIMAEDNNGSRSMPSVFKVTAKGSTSVDLQFLYFPFVRSTGAWETELGIVNVSENSELNGAFFPYDQSGKKTGASVNVSLNPMERKQLTVGLSFSDPDSIRYIAFEYENGRAVGYQRPSFAGQYRAAVPAAALVESDVVYVPHVASSDMWWTLISLVNTRSAEKTIEIEFDDGSAETILLGPGECRQFLVKDLFEGAPQEGIHSAEIAKAEGIVGLELFGNENQLSGVLLDDRLSDLICYPHIASDNHWETGLVAYNPGLASCRLTVAPYTELGSPLTPEVVDIPSKGRYFGTVSDLGLPEAAAWIEIQAESPVAGFELFAMRDGKQLAGYTGVKLAKTDGVLPLLEKDGATGIAFVNVGDESGTVIVTAYNDEGEAVAVKAKILAPRQKYVSRAEDLFEEGILDATYLCYSSSREVVMFQLNASPDMKLLDALPGL